jgi:hypothetical protein
VEGRGAISEEVSDKVTRKLPTKSKTKLPTKVPSWLSTKVPTKENDKSAFGVLRELRGRRDIEDLTDLHPFGLELRVSRQ